MTAPEVITDTKGRVLIEGGEEMGEEKSEDYTVDRFEHDKVMLHLSWTNRRMLIALVTVCLTFIITIIVFVSGYTQREKNWLDTIGRMQRQQVVEVNNGKQNTGQ